jgi:deoxyribodipyrimidine photo-lyase
LPWGAEVRYAGDMTSTPTFPASRTDARNRLTHFVARSGTAYASGRNTDSGPDQPAAVSLLSPYVRHRLITEQEIISSVLARHSLLTAEKFVQEVLWRTYWKGWLEMRPQVWSRFLAERDQQRNAEADTSLLAAAETGTTGIDGFDDWARALVSTGYLHNHARMWFASIWIFTLRLPWTLGADFFLRHLLDADAASNTLSWRWVGGLQTAGKTYLATSENISRYTNGRFAPKGLAATATSLTEAPLEAANALPQLQNFDPRQPSLLLATPEDMNPESVIGNDTPVRMACIAADTSLLWGKTSASFVSAAAIDTAARVKSHFSCPVEKLETLDAAALIAAAQTAKVTQIVSPYAPVGPVASCLSALEPVLAEEGIKLVQVRRRWDSQFWPLATKGFFPFKEQIPAKLKEVGLT